MEFTDENTGYFTAPTGVVRKSTNGGTSWNAVTTGLATNITGVSFPMQIQVSLQVQPEI
jgi:photosystem II stability/assembly factor-like uncharacterized protein